MKFLCLMYCEPRFFDTSTPAELKAFQDACMASDKALQNSGHLLGAQALQSAKAAVTLRIRDGKSSITDGPFAETKEQLCGFILIEARDMEEAKTLSLSDPFAKAGSVEIRPVMEF